MFFLEGALVYDVEGGSGEEFLLGLLISKLEIGEG